VLLPNMKKLYTITKALRHSFRLATIYSDTGSIYHLQGNYREGAKYYDKALQLKISLLGATHLEVGVAYNNYASALLVTMQLQEAKINSTKAVAIGRKLLSQRHPDLGKFLVTYATILAQLGEDVEAEKYATQALGIIQYVHGDSHTIYADVLTVQGNILARAGKHRDAVRSYEKALHVKQIFYGNDHLEVANLYVALASCYKEMKDLQRTRQYIQKAESSSQFQDNKPSQIGFFGLMGDAYQSLGEYARAAGYFTKRIELAELLLGNDTPILIAFIAGLVGLQLEAQNYAAAKPFALRAVEACKKLLPEKDPQLGVAYHNLSLVNLGLGEMEAYEKRAKLAAEVLNHNNDLAGKAVNLATQGMSFFHNKNFSQAKQFLANAAAIQEKISGVQDPTYTHHEWNSQGYACV
jgi:tetratricopeptide (TPR) repeat protein